MPIFITEKTTHYIATISPNKEIDINPSNVYGSPIAYLEMPIHNPSNVYSTPIAYLQVPIEYREIQS